MTVGQTHRSNELAQFRLGASSLEFRSSAAPYRAIYPDYILDGAIRALLLTSEMSGLFLTRDLTAFVRRSVSDYPSFLSRRATSRRACGALWAAPGWCGERAVQGLWETRRFAFSIGRQDP